VQHHIGIGMPNEPARMRDGKAAEDKWATFCQPMRIVSAADSEGHSRDSPQVENLRGL
jgi:hypothetical protein